MEPVHQRRAVLLMMSQALGRREPFSLGARLVAEDFSERLQDVATLRREALVDLDEPPPSVRLIRRAG